jgi:hypothetical protein
VETQKFLLILRRADLSCLCNNQTRPNQWGFGVVANQTKGHTISDQSAVTLALLRVQQPWVQVKPLVATATALARCSVARASSRQAVLFCKELQRSARICYVLLAGRGTDLAPTEGKSNAPYL